MRLVWCAVGALMLLSACAHEAPVGTYERGSEARWLDSPAMSTRLDKRDLEEMFSTLARDLMGSTFYGRYAQAAPRVTMAIAPFLNETTEHIDVQLDALVSKVETLLVVDEGFDVVSRERQDGLVVEVVNQQQEVFDPARAAVYGKLVGAEYIVIGKVFDAAERTTDMRRVQYMAFLQVIEVDTGMVRWQGETDVTKAYVAGR